MRQVDHAHQTVGDRESQCRQQQDAAEACAAENAADHFTGSKLALDSAQRFASFAAHFRIGFNVATRLLLENTEQ